MHDLRDSRLNRVCGLVADDTRHAFFNIPAFSAAIFWERITQKLLMILGNRGDYGDCGIRDHICGVEPTPIPVSSKSQSHDPAERQKRGAGGISEVIGSPVGLYTLCQHVDQGRVVIGFPARRIRSVG